jgi:hypothetical protein
MNVLLGWRMSAIELFKLDLQLLNLVAVLLPKRIAQYRPFTQQGVGDTVQTQSRQKARLGIFVFALPLFEFLGVYFL